MSKSKTYLFLICSFVFLLMTILVMNKQELWIDQFMFSFVVALDTPIIKDLFVIITEFGSKNILISGTILLTFLLLFLKKKQDAIMLVCLMIGGSLLNLFLKAVFARERPEVVMIYDGFGYSYPSNHSMMSFLLYGFIIYWLRKNLHNRAWAFSLQILLAILILLIGFSRIYLGVHFVSDVLGGFALAAMLLIVADVMKEHFNRRIKR